MTLIRPPGSNRSFEHLDPLDRRVEREFLDRRIAVAQRPVPGTRKAPNDQRVAKEAGVVLGDAADVAQRLAERAYLLVEQHLLGNDVHDLWNLENRCVGLGGADRTVHRVGLLARAGYDDRVLLVAVG